MQEFAWLRLNQFRDMVEFAADRVDERKLRLVACGCVRRAPQLLEHPRLRAAFDLAEAFADYRANKQQLKAALADLRVVVDELRRKADAELPEPTLSALDIAFEDLLRRAYGAAAVAEFQHQQAEVYRSSRVESDPAVVAARFVSHVVGTWTFTPGVLSDIASRLQNYIGVPSDAPHPRWWVDTVLCDVVRDVVGNPFRPVAFDPSWRTDTAMSLARVMYETRDFSAMPILADALQDAGCDDNDVLDHCRGGRGDRGEPVGGSPHTGGTGEPEGVHVRGCWVVDRLRPA